MKPGIKPPSYLIRNPYSYCFRSSTQGCFSFAPGSGHPLPAYPRTFLLICRPNFDQVGLPPTG